MKAIHITTVGMHCSACTALVESSVRGIAGVLAVTSSESHSGTSVLYDEAIADVDEVLIAITAAGFDASVES